MEENGGFESVLFEESVIVEMGHIRYLQHPSAEIIAVVAGQPMVGDGCRFWHNSQVRAGAKLGANCIIGKGAYIDAGVTLGDNCKVQNYACVYGPANLGDGVFVGPHAVIANDTYPRAVNPDGTLKKAGDWEILPTEIGDGASIGAGAIVLPGCHVGEWAMVAAGAVVTKEVYPYALVVGVPAQVVEVLCRCGRPFRGPGTLCNRCASSPIGGVP